MKYIDVERLRARIEKDLVFDNSIDTAYYRGRSDAEWKILTLIDSLQQKEPNSEDLLEWAKKKFNEVEIAMETGADDPALWGERNAFKQVIDKLNSMKNEQLG